MSTWSLAVNAIEELLNVVPSGSTVLEIGTGCGTAALASHYKVLSVEHEPEWHTGDSELIHVPLVSCQSMPMPLSFWQRFPQASEWYDPRCLRDALVGRTYDAIILDGPPGSACRAAAWWFYERVFDTQVPVLVDDVSRSYEWSVAVRIARVKGVSGFRVHMDENESRMFAVIQ